jgi:hypothetical protein
MRRGTQGHEYSTLVEEVAFPLDVLAVALVLFELTDTSLDHNLIQRARII